MTVQYVCAACFDEPGMQEYCRNHAVSKVCSFCGRRRSRAIAAPLDDVTEHINNCVHMYYDDPGNAGLAFESAEGGYQGITYDSGEVLEEMGLDNFPNDTNDQLRDEIIQGLDTDLWCETDPYGLSRIQQLSFSWERFCNTIKHERRFFFLSEKPQMQTREELLGPGQILEQLFSYAKEAGAFVDLPAGTRVWRARYQPRGKTLKTPGQLGPPPVEHAVQTNRMSPPGVVMTYVSEDVETALAETASEAGNFAVGEFVIDRKLLILDFTKLPAAPSPFLELPDSLEHDPRPLLQFLNQIAWEISRPIARDDRVHVEYVPTQVVTEYVRTQLLINERPVSGIRYRSSRNNAKNSLVLFADQSNLILEHGERPDFYRTQDRWLRLRNAGAKKVTAKLVNKWKS